MSSEPAARRSSPVRAMASSRSAFPGPRTIRSRRRIRSRGLRVGAALLLLAIRRAGALLPGTAGLVGLDLLRDDLGVAHDDDRGPLGLDVLRGHLLHLGGGHGVDA